MMKHFIQKEISLCLAFILSSCFLLSAFAVNYDAQKTEQNRIIQESQEKKQEIQKSLNQIISAITETSKELSDAENELEELNLSLKENQEALTEAQKKEQEQTDSLRKRLRAIYEDGSLSYFNVLMSSDSIFDFFYKLEILKQITEYDNNLLNTIKSTRLEIEERQKQIEADKLVAEEKKTVVVAKKKDLDAQSQQKKTLIDKENKNIEAAKARLKQIEAEEERIRREIAAKQSGSNAPVYSASGMIWPAPSCRIVTSEYGMRFHPTLHVNKLHSGMDIGCYSGTPVVAAQSGTVITATYNTAYGNYIVINHGNGVSTLYAHNSTLLVKPGQTVKQGQTISKSGNTGYSTGPHLHFEVLVNGSPKNPRNYVKP